MDREGARRLIDKYIHLKPVVQQAIDKFSDEHFKGKYVITVHYRGTDKFTEAPRVSYDMVLHTILMVVSGLKNQNYVVFLATDEIDLVNYMSICFGTKLCYQDNIRASGGVIGLHCLPIDMYQHQFEALTDMLLLSKGDHLIRTSSNLSKWSTWWNPKMKVTELNKRHGF
jgi:hypothetical protein